MRVPYFFVKTKTLKTDLFYLTTYEAYLTFPNSLLEKTFCLLLSLASHKSTSLFLLTNYTFLIYNYLLIGWPIMLRMALYTYKEEKICIDIKNIRQKLF